MRFEFDLTVEQAKLLAEVITDYDDCGTIGDGWQSKELRGLSEYMFGIISMTLKAGECKTLSTSTESTVRTTLSVAPWGEIGEGHKMPNWTIPHRTVKVDP